MVGLMSVICSTLSDFFANCQVVLLLLSSGSVIKSVVTSIGGATRIALFNNNRHQVTKNSSPTNFLISQGQQSSNLTSLLVNGINYALKAIFNPKNSWNKINKSKKLNWTIEPNKANKAVGETKGRLASSGSSSWLIQRWNQTSLSKIDIVKNLLNPGVAHFKRRLGKRAPFLSLLGVSLASGNGIITKQDEIESVCCEIRSAITKIESDNSESETVEVGTTLSDYYIGPVIAKGCSAVVYKARLSNEEIGNDDNEYHLAIKMMFNYHAASNALTIFRAMEKEIIPAQIKKLRFSNENIDEDLNEWLSEIEYKSVPPHPNIVEMSTAFVDFIPDIEGSKTIYPDALPTRLNPDGCGRNMSLFLVMKNYNDNLKNYLDNMKGQIPIGTSLSLLAQLLEGVSHLVRNNIAHRDLKSDNILLHYNDDSETPHLVIADFGCCSNVLNLPYTTREIDKGGNVALMAPEVRAARPGTFSYINYEKADIYAVGAIAYEIFGHPNPKYCKHQVKLSEEIPLVIRNLIAEMCKDNPKKRIDAETATTIVQLLLWLPAGILNSKRKKIFSMGDPVLEWLLTMTTKVLVEARFCNKKLGTEYTLIATFLRRFKLDKIKSAIIWIQNNSK